MKFKIKIPVKFHSETTVSIPSEKSMEPAEGVRLHARQILCSFSMMLTEREKMALHWLAEGLTAREIAYRLYIRDCAPVEIRHAAGCETRSLSFTASHATAIPRDTISGPRQRLGGIANSSADMTQQNENPS